MSVYRRMGRRLGGPHTRASVRLRLLNLCLGLCCTAGANAAMAESFAFEHEAMATTFRFTLYARPEDKSSDDLRRVAEEAFQAVDDLESRVSNWIPDSQMSYVNNHAAEAPVKVAPDLFALMLYAKALHREGGGTFDITVGPLIDLWGFYKNEGHLPTPDELRKTLETVGMERVHLDENGSTIRFDRPGIRLDFGGIAKGLALDKALEVLKRYGVAAALLDGGTSSVYALGAPPGEAGWTVRIKDPYNKDRWIDEVTLRDESLSTSGNYEKFFEIGGHRYCHIFDPRTGMPVEGMLSASAIAPTGMESDGLTKVFFVGGVEHTRAYCKAHPGIRAILVPIPRDGSPKPVRIGFPSTAE